LGVVQAMLLRVLQFSSRSHGKPSCSKNQIAEHKALQQQCQ